MAADICLICEEPFEEDEKTRTPQKKSIQTLISVSIERQDNKHYKYKLRDKECVTVHENCYKSYVNASSINKYKIQKKAQIASTSTGATFNNFDFEKNCLLCGKDASETFLKRQCKKKNPSKRQRVKNVTAEELQNTILHRAGDRSDNWSSEVLDRVASVTSLIDVQARYHDLCYLRFFHANPKSATNQILEETSTVIDLIERFIKDHPNEDNFSLKQIIDSYEGEAANDQWLKKKWYERLGNDIIITSKTGSEPIIYLRDSCHNILLQTFKDSQNQESDRIKIVTAAAKIIAEDIRAQEYDVETYPSPNSFFENVEEVIPNSLRVFLDNVALSDKQGTETAKFLSKIVGIAHAIISYVRPCSFISSLKIGLGAVLNKKFGSKALLNILSSLGFCCSYDEALLFEASVLSEPNNAAIDPESFSQFVFHNADHNINTIDGLHTFHAMGGIECVTPTSAVLCNYRIPKLKAIPPQNTVGSFGTLALKAFHGYKKAGLENVLIENLSVKNPTVGYDFDISSTDLLWIYNHEARFTDVQGWNGFMEKLTAGIHYQKSRIVCLPFLNHPPSNYDTIYTVLRFAAERIENRNQKITFVTLDQPLYWKAKEIIHSTEDPNLKNVVVRLGGFHLVMSFLGSIGHIMDGSGLKELFSEIYAPASVDKTLAGHAYSRAVRAHSLVHCALVQMIIRSTDFTEEETTKLRTILENPDSIFENINADEEFKNMKTKFIETVNRLAGRSGTAKLWTQYLHMVSLLKSFIEAEKSGNWQLHLRTVHRMLPFFHSTGHHLHAKSAHLYLQDMYNLKERMDGDEYEKFVNGGFTIRRTDKFWSGIWSDMTIEQTLMRAIKDIGGPTRGREMTDSVLSKWVLTTPALIDLIEALTDFCKVYLATTEQHVDSRPTRIARDISDIIKVLSWFESHNPFPETEGIISLSTGLEGGKDDHINCHEALEIGVKCLTEMWEADSTGNPRSFNDVKYRKKNKVIPLKALVSAIRVSDRTVTIDPLLLFHRISMLKKSDDEWKNYYTHELAPYPLSLFNENGMLKGTKSKMYDFFTPIASPSKANDIFVIDGDFFLHKVVWRPREIFNDILSRYVNYLTNNYSKNCVVVFDGYPENAAEKHTKSAERLRRARLTSAPEVVCDLKMPSTLPQDKFFSNEKNKVRLINILSDRLRNDGFQVCQAVEDADSLIIDTALSLSDCHDSVYIVGEDVDLVVILTQIGQDRKNVYLLKPSRGKVEQRLYSVDSFKFPEIRHLVCFIHAFTGCDTTSAIHNQEKAKLIELLNAQKNDLTKEAEIFNNTNASKCFLYAAGQRIMMALYGAQEGDRSHDEYRYKCSTTTTLKSKFSLSSLPPTADACNEHVLRTFLQVCEWRGDRTKDPVRWGWKKSNNILMPITCRNEPIPESLLDVISCACDNSQCVSNCTCREAGLKCTILCKKCNGQSCSNVIEPDIILSDEDVDDDLVFHLTDESNDCPLEDYPLQGAEIRTKKKKISDTGDEQSTKKRKLLLE